MDRKFIERMFTRLSMKLTAQEAMLGKLEMPLVRHALDETESVIIHELMKTKKGESGNE